MHLGPGIWVADGKGQGVLQPLLRGICSQRRESLLEYIIGDPAFESPGKAAKWRKDQINDNPEIARLVSLIDRKLQSNADSVDLLYAPSLSEGCRQTFVSSPACGADGDSCDAGFPRVGEADEC